MILLKDKLIKEVEYSVKKNQPLSKKTIYLTFVGPLVAALLLFIMAVTNNTHSKDWVHHLMLYILGPSIVLSVFYIFKSKYTGAYGEVVFLLVPILIWILKPRINVETIKVLSIFAFILGVFGTGLLIFGKMFKHNYIKAEKPQEVTVKYTTIILRFSFILISIMSIMIISILLSNWADLAMNFAHAKKTKAGVLVYNYNSSQYISFVAVVTILIALAVITINLVSSFLVNIKRDSKKIVANDNPLYQSNTKMINVKKTNEIKLTQKQKLIEKRYAKQIKKQKEFDEKERDNSGLTVEILTINKRKGFFNKKKNPWNR